MLAPPRGAVGNLTLTSGERLVCCGDVCAQESSPSSCNGRGSVMPDIAPIEVTGVVQRESWLARVVPPVEQLRADLWSIPVPMPESPLRYVSVYVLANDSSLTLIDAGWDSDESWAALCDGLSGIGASITNVAGVLVTHQHFDHIGLARRVREASGAWIGLHPADRDAILRPEFRQPEVAAPADMAWLVRLGASREEAVRLRGDPSQFDPRGTIAVPDRLIEDGEMVGVPGWSLRAVHTPGHTPGHLCFADEKTRLLFAGDHVLPRISPNISADRREDVDALGDFLQSLDKVAACDIDEVLPAHEWRFRGLTARVAQLQDHHERRLTELLKAITEQPGSVPWELAGQLAWSRPWDQYDGFMRIAAVAETMAHIVHLLRRGLVTATNGAVPRYTAAPPTG
jgi:glyoxylase-like metal-dependent hydrolase (beta-lactamase superfamily II)